LIAIFYLFITIFIEVYHTVDLNFITDLNNKNGDFISILSMKNTINFSIQSYNLQYKRNLTLFN